MLNSFTSDPAVAAGPHPHCYPVRVERVAGSTCAPGPPRPGSREPARKAVSGSRLVIVDEGGHYSYRRHWQEWNPIVDAFLQENE